MILEHAWNHGLGMAAPGPCMLWSPYARGTRAELCLGHGCSGHRMPVKHERNCALGMDALVAVCSWNPKGIMLGAWVL